LAKVEYVPRTKSWLTSSVINDALTSSTSIMYVRVGLRIGLPKILLSSKLKARENSCE